MKSLGFTTRLLFVGILVVPHLPLFSNTTKRPQKTIL